MGKKKPEMEVTEYRMTIHFGICAGPIDCVKRILVGEKVAWEGFVGTLTDIAVRARDLFGGVKKEGGAEGSAIYLPGEDSQLLPARVNTKYGLTADEMPAYRGIASIFFTEAVGAALAGFYWSAQTPYLRGVWITVQRLARGLNDAYAGISQFVLSEWDADIDSQKAVAHAVTDYANDTEGRYTVSLNGSTIQAWTDDRPDGATNWTQVDVYGTPQSLAVSNGYVFSGYQTDGIINVYEANSGAHRATITLTTGGSNCAVYASPASTEALGGGGEYDLTETYVLRHGSYISLCKGSGNSWAEVSEYAVPGWLASVDSGCLTPHGYYLIRYGFLDPQTDPIVYFYEIDDDELQAPVIRNLAADFQVGELAAAVGYGVDSDVVVVIGNSGGFYVYNRDLSVLLRSSVSAWVLAGRQARGGQRMFSSADTVTIMVQGAGASRYLAQYSVSTAALILYEPMNDLYDTDTNSGHSWWATNNKNNYILVGGATGVSPVLQFSIPPASDLDANPAHILYETLTNRTWGMGTSSLAIDVQSFEDAAVVLHGERFGLSIIWTRQSSVESFAQEILDHIEATMFVSPRTGLLTLRLIRNDYDIGDLKTYDTSNSKLTSFKRRLWGETTNEINVSFTNRENEEEETVTAQDSGNIAIQGDIISSGRNYYGVRNASLAMRVAQRDLRVASAPLASCDIEVNRDAWDLLPGGVCIIVSPEDHVTQMVMRVGPIDYGRAGAPTIKASLAEDVFSLATAEYDTPPESEWEDPSELPSPIDFTHAFTMPFYLALNKLDPTVIGDDEYPTVYAAVLAAEDGTDTREFELIGELTGPAGNVYLDSLGTRTITSRSELTVALAQEVESVILTLARTQGGGPTVGGLLVIGDGAEVAQEICLITVVTAVSFTIKRGVLDTTPKDWIIGEPIWYLNANSNVHDNEARSDGEVLTYMILPHTSLGTLDAGEAGGFDMTATGRPWLPSRPADVKIEATAFGVLDAQAINPMDVTWNERNRLTEDSQILAWDDATVTAEAGTTYRIVLTALDGTPITAITGLSGTSYSLAHASFGLYSRAMVSVYAERDALVSLQGHAIEVIVAEGYGFDYGYNYGGI